MSVRARIKALEDQRNLLRRMVGSAWRRIDELEAENERLRLRLALAEDTASVRGDWMLAARARAMGQHPAKGDES